ncbi:MAG: HPF/RaiA family ribosome-associated protein [Bacteroidales bacterium]|nr:HPF/RaiA family ribosome-associated protein [Bacteroidales bacterium]
MRVNINAVHFKADKKLVAFINEKVVKLTQVFDGVIDTEVSLKVDNSDTRENKIAEIRVAIPGNSLFVKKQSATFEESADDAVEALKRQLKRYKEKLKGPY